MKVYQSGAGYLDEGYVNGSTYTVAPGEYLSFSAYIKTNSGNALLGLWDGTTTLKTTVLYNNRDWTRQEVTYANRTNASVTVTPQVIAKGNGDIYIDCVQVEKTITRK